MKAKFLLLALFVIFGATVNAQECKVDTVAACKGAVKEAVKGAQKEAVKGAKKEAVK